MHVGLQKPFSRVITKNVLRNDFGFACTLVYVHSLLLLIGFINLFRSHGSERNWLSFEVSTLPILFAVFGIPPKMVELFSKQASNNSLS